MLLKHLLINQFMEKKNLKNCQKKKSTVFFPFQFLIDLFQKLFAHVLWLPYIEEDNHDIAPTIMLGKEIW